MLKGFGAYQFKGREKGVTAGKVVTADESFTEAAKLVEERMERKRFGEEIKRET